MKTRTDKKNAGTLRELARRALVVLLTVSMVSMNSPLAYAAETMGEERNANVVTEQGTITAQSQQTSEQAPAAEPTAEAVPAQQTTEPAAQSNDGGTATATTEPTDATPTKTEPAPVIEVVDSGATLPESEVEARLRFENAYIYYKGQAVASPLTSIKVPAGEDLEFAATADDGFKLDAVKTVVDGIEKVLEPDASGLYVVPAADVVKGLVLSVSAVADPLTAGDTSTKPIEEKRNEKSEFVFEDDTVKVVATLTDPEALPADVTFKVTRVTRDTKDAQGNKAYDYDAYMEALNRDAVGDVKYTDSNTVLMDAAFLVPKVNADGTVVEGEWTEIQLEEGLVKLDFQFKKNQLSEAAQTDSADIEINHLPLRDSVRAKVDSTADANNLSANDIIVERPADQGADVDTEQAEVSLDSLSIITFTDLTTAEQTAIEANKYPITVTVQNEDGTEVPISNLGSQVEIGINYTVKHQWYSSNETSTVPISGDSGTTFEVNISSNDPYTITNLFAKQNGKTYYVGQIMGDYLIDGEVATNGARLIMRKVSESAIEPYTVTTKFYDYDKTTKLNTLSDDAALTSDVAVVAKLTKKGSGPDAEPLAWAIENMPKSYLNSHGDATVTFNNGFAVCDASYNATNRKIGYDATKYDLDVSLYTSKYGQTIYTYADAMRSDRAVPNYDPFYRDVDTEGSSNLLIKLHRGFTKSLNVKINNTSNSAITANDKIFVVATMKHASTGDSYCAVPVTVGAHSEVVLPITDWRDGNGNAKANEEYTGNQEISIRLVKATNSGDFQYTQVNNSGLYRTINQGDLVGTATLSVGELETVTNDAERTKTFTQEFTLSENYNVFDDGVDYTTILDNAKYFGIVANEWDQYESETNAAVKRITHTTQQSGNDLVNSETGTADDKAQPWYIGEINGNLLIKGFSVDVYAPKSEQGKITPSTSNTGTTPAINYHTVSKEAVGEYIDQMRAHVIEQSNQLATKDSLVGAYPVADAADHFELDFTGYAGGTIYIPLDKEIQRNDGSWVKVIDLIGSKADTCLRIKKNSNQVVVLNSNEKHITMQDFAITMTDVNTNETRTYGSSSGLNVGVGDPFSTEVASTLVWNFPQAETVNIDKRIAGIVLAPNATVTESDGACGGWIVCDKFSNPGGKEWHNVWQHYDQEYEKIVDISGIKELEGNDLAAGQFVFDLYRVENGQRTFVESKANDANGKITFVIKVTEEGTYNYEFSEVLPSGVDASHPSKDGITYDTTVHHVTVNVTKKGQTNNRYLTATVTYDGKEELPTFKNKQQDTNTTDVKAKKVWSDGATSGAIEHPAVTLHLVKHVGNGEEVVDGQDRVIPKDATGDYLTVEWNNLPVKDDNGNDITYTVTEDEVSGYTKAIEWSDAEQAYVVTNTKDVVETGELTVSKTVVSGRAADADVEFDFTVTLGDTTINGTYGDMTFADGVATFKLKGGGSKTATGLPTGVTYTVEEGTADGFKTEKTGDTGTISTTASTAAFTNTRGPELGSLEVTKTVSTDMSGDRTKKFTFTVELKDNDNNPVSGTYGVTTFTDGAATFQLADGETKTITSLPAGVKYHVTETDNAYYTVTYDGEDGTIVTNETAHTTVTNARQTGGLEVSKTVTPEALANDTDEFTFTVTLSDTTVNGTYGGMTFASGVATVTLKSGQSKSATGLPAGITYTVVETPHDGYTADTASRTGAVPANNTVTAAFTNTRETGGLEVTKTVVSDRAADADVEFEFTVTLGDTSINGTYGGMTFTDGVATFKLKGGESKNATGLPTEVTYTVAETTAAGFTTIKTGETGTISKDVDPQTEGNQHAVAAFTNTRETGDLTVSKTVVSAKPGDADAEFTFTVTLGDTTISGTYGDMTFADGVATVKIKGGESKSATGLPTEVTYTVAETTAAGFTTTKTGDEGTISTTPSTAAFTNTRETGALEVTKAVTSSTGSDKSLDFTFTVDMHDERFEGTFDDVTFTKGVATFTLKDGGTKRITGLPVGMAYTVTEAAADGFVTTKTGDTGTISATDSVASFTNTKEEGGLVVTKEVTSDLAADANVEFTFTVTLSDDTISGEYGGMSFTNGKATFKLKDGENKSATGLPKGIGYTVTETADDGFTTTKTGETGEISEATSTAAFTNTRKKGNLDVAKTVVSNRANDASKYFTFTVTLSDTTISGTYGDMDFANGVATFTLKGGEKATAIDLPTSVGYTVAEVAATGFTTAKTGDEGTISGTTSTAVFTNTREVGDLEVTKTVTSARPGDDQLKFDFTVTLDDTTINGTYGDMTFEGGKATFKLKGGESKSATGLPTDVTYTVIETPVGGFETAKTGDTGTISTDKSTAAFTNTRETGALEVTKSVTSSTDSDKSRDFTFTVDMHDERFEGTFDDVTFTKGVATFTLKDGGTKRITGLPVGMEYTVSEATADGFVTTKTGDTGTISATKSQVSFTNTKEEGGLVVTKTVVSPSGSDKQKDFAFTVTLDDTTVNGTYGDMTFADGVATFTLKDGGTMSATGLARGIGYTVTETAADGFTTTKTGETGEISDTTSTAAFTNTRTTGGFNISKQVVSDASADLSQNYTFEVTLSDETISGTFGDMYFENGVATVTIVGNGTRSATGLPADVTYSVAETTVEGLTVDAQTKGGTVAEQAPTTTFTNTREVGDLTVTKMVVSDRAADADAEFTFTVTLGDTTIGGAEGKTYGGMTFKNGVATVTLKGGETATATGLPTDVTYTVEETTAAGFTTNKTGDTGTISTTPSTATFTNTRKTGGLEVTKTVISDRADDHNTDFTFTVTLDDTTIGGDEGKAYGDMTFTNGVATFTLKDGGKATATGLPTGIGYTVTETADDGFVTTKSGDTGAISTSPSTAAFTNTRKQGGLMVSKTVVSDKSDDANVDFAFTVTLSDDTISGEYGGMSFTSGKATFTLKGGETKTATGLPSGIGYTVEETAAEGFVTTKTGETGQVSDSEDTAVAAFTNTRETGDLEVAKTVVSDRAADADQAFTFTVTLSDDTISGTYGDMAFENGVATFTLKGGEKATAAGLPTDVTYTVTEGTADGFELTGKTGDTGTISETLSTAAFTNTRETGGLVVTKTVTSNKPGDNKLRFSFTVTLDDDTIGGSEGKAYGDMTFKNGVATFTLKDGGKATATGLPTGIGYTVTETADGFSMEATGDTGTISTAGSTAAFTNTRETGALEVTKTVASSTASDRSIDFAFEVDMHDEHFEGTFDGVTFTKGVATLTLKDGGTKRITGLPVGMAYTVTEAMADGFVTTKTGDTGTITTVGSAAAFTNTREEGGLVVAKSVTSPSGSDLEKSFAFTVTLSDKTINGTYGEMAFADGVAHFDLKSGETRTATGLAKGLGYTVTETADNDFQTSATGDTGTIPTGNVPRVAEFANTRKLGGLNVSKQVVSDASADLSRQYSFAVSLSDETVSGTFGDMYFDKGKAIVELVGNGTKSATGLPAGVTYTVTEAAVEGLVADGLTKGGTVADPAPTTTFTNTRETGDLEVTKTVSSERAADADEEFEFTVTLSDTTIGGGEGKAYGDMTFKNGVATFTLKNGGKAIATGLPTGVGYTVEEAAATGFDSTKTGATGTISTSPSTATFTNTRKTGGLEVTKTVISDRADDHNTDFAFTVTLSDDTIGGDEGKAYGDMTFTNGVATFSLKDGGKATATGLPTGIGYTVTETADDGFVTTKSGDTGAISTSPSTAAFTNTRKQGGLMVSKTVVSDKSDDANVDFAFTVILSDDTISGEYGGMSFTSGKATFTLKGGETKTATGLPSGIGYTVEETAAEGFVTTKTGETGQVSDSEDTAVAAFTNKRETGDLEVAKTVVSDRAADHDKSFAFTVTLSDSTISGTYGDMAFENGVATFTLKGGEKATATGLPTDVTYEVNETAADGFELTGKAGDTGTISTNKSEAAFTNKRETGDLEVTKTVNSFRPGDGRLEFDFTVTLGDDTINGDYGQMRFEGGVATFTLTDGETRKATGLPTDVTYVVTEAPAAGFETTSTGDAGTISETKSSATFTNTRETGRLEVTKTVASSTASDRSIDFAFEVDMHDEHFGGTYDGVEFKKGKGTFTLRHGQTKSITGLPVGMTYTVTEATADGFVTTRTGDTGTISAATSTAAFTNTRKEGGLMVTKSVASPSGSDKQRTFAFTVTLTDTSISGTYGEMAFEGGVATFELSDGQGKTATGLPEGIGYTVAEEAAEGFVTTYEGRTGRISDTDDTAVATVTNTRETGELEVAKAVVSDKASDSDAEFAFTVTLSDTTISGTYGDMSFVDGVATFELKGGEKATATGLPTGVTYAVAETAADGFTTTKTGDTGTISKDVDPQAEGNQHAVAAFTNTREVGDLEVTKTVTSERAADADAEFAFTVTLTGAPITGTYGDMAFTGGVATFELKGGESKVATGLPTGVDYTVQEDAAAGFETAKTGETGMISTTPSKAAFANTRKVGGLEVTKAVSSDRADDHQADFSFTVTLDGAPVTGTYGDMAFENGVASFTLKDGGKATAKGLPTDVAYTVTEATDDGFVTTSSGDTGTISTSLSTAAFTNTRKQGGLMVSKTVVSDKSDDAARDFAFKVTLGDSSISGTYGDMAFEGGVAEFALRGGETKTATGLPTGIRYTVEETADGGFTTTKSGETGQIGDSAEPAHAAFTNTRKTGDLEVKKELVSDKSDDAARDFAFKVTLGDDTISGIYGGMAFEGGVATFRLKGGETKTATGLPTDVTYTVEETAADGFELTGKTGDTGTISGTPSTSTFTNTRKTGDLEVTKTVDSVLASADNQLDFNFKVTLGDTTINGTYGDMTFTNGVATFTLKHDETATATGLPTDVTYTVTETADGFETTSTDATGTISTTASTAAFTNRRQVGSLKIKKSVLVDDKATNTTAADGTYWFRIQGPGEYSGEGQKRSITITNGQANDLVLQNLPIGAYTITELNEGLASNVHIMSLPQTVIVTDGDEADVPVAQFTNNLTTVSAHMEASKKFDNWDDSNVEGIDFVLTPVVKNGVTAPMPAGVPAQTIPVTKDAPKATFGDIKYAKAGVYEYQIREVVPEGAVDGKFQGVQYETQAHKATVIVNENFETHVFYDNNNENLAIENTYAAQGKTHLTATKQITGRSFKAGDRWTFNVTATGDNAQSAPMPERDEVTITPSEGSSASIDFGDITYGLEHAGKTYTYEISESGSVSDVQNDGKKTVTVTVTNNGNGTLDVQSNATEDSVKFTNRYRKEVDLVATKYLANRSEWKVGEEYNFMMTASDDWSKTKMDNSPVSAAAVTRGSKHEAKFGTFVFTADDADEYFTYDVREVAPTGEGVTTDPDTGEAVLNGMHYDNHLYTVQYHVTLQNNELNVETTYSRGEEQLEGINVTNTYAPKPTTARVEAKKAITGRELKAGDKFTFQLWLETKEGARELVATKSTDDYDPSTNADTLSVTFDNVPCNVGGTDGKPHVENYVITEVVPDDAVEKTAEDGTKYRVLDGMTYDTVERRVTISTDDDQNGNLTATVYYENNQMPTFTNRYFGAEATMSFNKEFYGANLNEGAFDFTMRATDDQYNVREGTAVVHRDDFVDDGGAHTVKMSNGTFEGNVAKVVAPTITYHEPGEYYYEISEDSKSSTDDVAYDAAKIRVKVTVGKDASTNTEYWLFDGETATKTTTPTLYNNGLISLSMRSSALRAMAEATSTTRFVPAVHKVLKNGVLHGGEYSFAMYEGEGTDGRLLTTGKNDSNGAITFEADAIEYGPSDIGPHTYTIVENQGDDETVAYDTDTIRLTVNVKRGSDGEVVAEADYAKFNADGTPDTTDPDTFVNEYDTIIIHAVKRSREEPYDPLPGAHYGLWMVNPDGEDVYMGLGRNQQEREGSELVSSDNGDLYYDIPLLEGVAYYFLEEWPPPAGHLVDPYPTDYFTLVHDKENGKFRLVYEADSDFAKYCPGITR